jgi:hypothetical protein
MAPRLHLNSQLCAGADVACIGHPASLRVATLQPLLKTRDRSPTSVLARRLDDCSSSSRTGSSSGSDADSSPCGAAPAAWGGSAAHERGAWQTPVAIKDDSCCVARCAPGRRLRPEDVPLPRANTYLEEAAALASMLLLFGRAPRPCLLAGRAAAAARRADSVRLTLNSRLIRMRAQDGVAHAVAASVRARPGAPVREQLRSRLPRGVHMRCAAAGRPGARPAPACSWSPALVFAAQTLASAPGHALDVCCLHPPVHGRLVGARKPPRRGAARRDDGAVPRTQLAPAFRDAWLWDTWRRHFRLRAITPPVPYLDTSRRFLCCQFPCGLANYCWMMFATLLCDSQPRAHLQLSSACVKPGCR